MLEALLLLNDHPLVALILAVLLASVLLPVLLTAAGWLFIRDMRAAFGPDEPH
jgi:hypothetical protein